jgi:hypothetical protein
MPAYFNLCNLQTWTAVGREYRTQIFSWRNVQVRQSLCRFLTCYFFKVINFKPVAHHTLSAVHDWLSIRSQLPSTSGGIFFENIEKFKFNHLTITTELYMKTFVNFFIISRSFHLRVRNVSDKRCRENQNTYFMFDNIFSPNSCCLWDNVGKCRWQPRTRQALWACLEQRRLQQNTTGGRVGMTSRAVIPQHPCDFIPWFQYKYIYRKKLT